MELNNHEKERYARQLILPEFGLPGQLKLKNAKILLVGVGGLGSPQAIYLSASGVGILGIIDPDSVALDNLHRQVIHFTKDVGKSKVVSAQEKIEQINPNVKVVTYSEKLTAQNALKIFKNYDLIIDGTDNFPARYLINDACVMLGKPFVFGGIFRFEGQVSIFGLKDGPCYRCLFGDPPAPEAIPSCAQAGVLGVLPGIVGLIQANEAIKIICGLGEPLRARLLIFDALTTTFREVRIQKDSACPMCGAHPTILKLKEYQENCLGEKNMEISVQELKQIMDDFSEKYVLIDVREPQEWDKGHIEGAVLKSLSILEGNYQDIPKDKKVFVHCQAGGRSATAVEFLRSKGYTNCWNVVGGMNAWAKLFKLSNMC